MRCKPFESAASELVSESEHPLEQLRLLDIKVQELGKDGDIDGIVECRIKQLCLQKVLVHLHEFPIRDLVVSQVALAEAYVSGGYLKQAHDHLARAKETCSVDVHDDGQALRLQVDLLIAEGFYFLALKDFEASSRALQEAHRIGRKVYGELSMRVARIHDLLGQIAQNQHCFPQAAEHLFAASQIREKIGDPSDEESLTLRLRAADSLHVAGRSQEAIDELRRLSLDLQKFGGMPSTLVDVFSQLARRLEECGPENDNDALRILQEAERVAEEQIGTEDAKVVDVKREIALLHLKLDNHVIALQYLQHVEYLERRLHGSQSPNVARTLKALGTVYMVQHNMNKADQCLQQALRIFESDYPPNKEIVRDIRSKLHSIANG